MSIKFLSDRKQFVIETEKFSYSFFVLGKYLRSAWWNKKLNDYHDIPTPPKEWINEFLGPCQVNANFHNSEFTGDGSIFHKEPTLKVTFADGVRDLMLAYQSHTIDGNKLKITLKDEYYNFYVDLLYQIYDGLDIIDRNYTIRNETGEKVVLNTVNSATVNLPYEAEEYTLTSFGSSWANEYELSRRKVTKASTVLQSRSGLSNTDNFPYFALTQSATENEGTVWFGALQWSGNWKISVEEDMYHYVRVTGGINDYDFSYVLKSGEAFETPRFTFGASDLGYSGASRQLHELVRNYYSPKAWADKVLPVIYNTWTSFEFDITEEKCLSLVDKAAYIGAELFVIDDGWFSTRDFDNSGLGDWYPSPTRFPNGLKPIIDKVNKAGMMFGIWVEPEMVNPDTELYKKHPDWVLNFPTRERELSRTQLILNLAREDVYNYIIGFLDELLENNNIGYLKWDMNRRFSQPGWPEMPADEQQSMWVKYVENFYRIFKHLNEKYPELIVENCASGGLRGDLSMSNYCSRINRSDNQDPIDELYLNEGFTYVNLPRSAGGAGHISANRKGVNERECSMQFKAHAGFMGSLGIGMDFAKMTDAEIEELKAHVAYYKTIRHIVQLGDMYRIKNLRECEYSATEFVSKDKSEALLFLFSPLPKFKEPFPPIKLYGLDSTAKYSVDGKYTASGDYLMKSGIISDIHLVGNMQSKIFKITKVDK